VLQQKAAGAQQGRLLGGERFPQRAVDAESLVGQAERGVPGGHDGLAARMAGLDVLLRVVEDQQVEPLAGVGAGGVTDAAHGGAAGLDGGVHLRREIRLAPAQALVHERRLEEDRHPIPDRWPGRRRRVLDDRAQQDVRAVEGLPDLREAAAQRLVEDEARRQQVCAVVKVRRGKGTQAHGRYLEHTLLGCSDEQARSAITRWREAYRSGAPPAAFARSPRAHHS
jgi:hypothetical protein